MPLMLAGMILGVIAASKSRNGDAGQAVIMGSQAACDAEPAELLARHGARGRPRRLRRDDAGRLRAAGRGRDVREAAVRLAPQRQRLLSLPAQPPAEQRADRRHAGPLPVQAGRARRDAAGHGPRDDRRARARAVAPRRRRAAAVGRCRRQRRIRRAARRRSRPARSMRRRCRPASCATSRPRARWRSGWSRARRAMRRPRGWRACCRPRSSWRRATPPQGRRAARRQGQGPARDAAGRAGGGRHRASRRRWSRRCATGWPRIRATRPPGARWPTCTARRTTRCARCAPMPRPTSRVLDYAAARDRFKAAQDLMRKGAAAGRRAHRPLRGVDHRHARARGRGAGQGAGGRAAAQVAAAQRFENRPPSADSMTRPSSE